MLLPSFYSSLVGSLLSDGVSSVTISLICSRSCLPAGVVSSSTAAAPTRAPAAKITVDFMIFIGSYAIIIRLLLGYYWVIIGLLVGY